jgi:putative ABC transport system substrate-binding protein
LTHSLGTAALALTLLIMPLQINAEPTSSDRHVGILYQDPKTASYIDWFREALSDLGYKDGKTITIDPRLASPGLDSLRIAASELSRSKVDLVVAVGTPAALAMQRASTTIPIVFVVGDPVASGLVASLGHPGRNATGLATLAGETGIKRLQLLKEVVPDARLIGVLVNRDNPATGRQLELIETAARGFGVELRTLSVHSGVDLDGAFAEAGKQGIDALIIVPDPILNANPAAIAQHALKRKIPSIFESPTFARLGGLISYGPSGRELWRACAGYADRILRGATPAELPVQQPTVFEFVVNLRTAKILGRSIPQSVLLQASEVIE